MLAIDKLSPESFKIEVVKQIIERGHLIASVASPSKNLSLSLRCSDSKKATLVYQIMIIWGAKTHYINTHK
ncbi:hypothetical protein [Candidatus Pantoea deserta]|uniref:hypothetical protein n=1 Tax=Candidatus Pantoea deserta TaxID=1869313 RepID=UPI000F50D281|nr:hypothetical protein [Pantoea deserta]